VAEHRGALAEDVKTFMSQHTYASFLKQMTAVCERLRHDAGDLTRWCILQVLHAVDVTLPEPQLIALFLQSLSAPVAATLQAPMVAGNVQVERMVLQHLLERVSGSGGAGQASVVRQPVRGESAVLAAAVPDADDEDDEGSQVPAHSISVRGVAAAAEGVSESASSRGVTTTDALQTLSHARKELSTTTRPDPLFRVAPSDGLEHEPPLSQAILTASASVAPNAQAAAASSESDSDQPAAAQSRQTATSRALRPAAGSRSGRKAAAKPPRRLPEETDDRVTTSAEDGPQASAAKRQQLAGRRVQSREELVGRKVAFDGSSDAENEEEQPHTPPRWPANRTAAVPSPIAGAAAGVPTASPGTPLPNFAPKLQRVRWSEREEEALIAGVEEHGLGNWKAILVAHQSVFDPTRRSLDLKDKWRCVRGRRVRLVTQCEGRGACRNLLRTGRV
jgi:hypothetical protein